MVQFIADAQRYCNDIVESPGPAGAGVEPDNSDLIDALFAAADHLALHFQRRVLLAMRGIHVLAALMGIAFVCYSDLPSDLIKQAMAVLAIVAAARESYSYRKAHKELIKQNIVMRNIFLGARPGLEAEQTMNAQREILRALGEAALAEHAEWALTHRERPLQHGEL